MFVAQVYCLQQDILQMYNLKMCHLLILFGTYIQIVMSNPHLLDRFFGKPVDESMNVFRNPKLYPYIYIDEQSVCYKNYMFCFIILLYQLYNSCFPEYTLEKNNSASILFLLQCTQCQRKNRQHRPMLEASFYWCRQGCIQDILVPR